MIDLEEVNRINDLLDIYGTLLSEKQLDSLVLSYRDNLSIGEIAEINKVSRAAVLDAINKGKENLEQYEEKLHLLRFIKTEEAKGDDKIQQVINRLKEALDNGI